VTQAEVDNVLLEARKQGIDFTQIAIFYGNAAPLPPGPGSFSSDGIPLASNGERLPVDKITGFHFLGAD
jgi:hypothetical protein